MFQRTLALSNNPFDPDNNPGWSNLSGQALRIDHDPTLLPLFSWSLGGLQQSKTAIDSCSSPRRRASRLFRKRAFLLLPGAKAPVRLLLPAT